MTEKIFHHHLLALHYVLPVPLNRLQPLLKVTPDLSASQKMSVQQLSHLLNLPKDSAQKFKASYEKVLETPLCQAYSSNMITPIPYGHPDYPIQLNNLYDPPAVLYAKGRVDFLKQKHYISVIGAREATGYSQEAIEYILPPLIKNNVVIVSGLAKGADAMAHQYTHDLGGRTIGVLGHGHFHQYPKVNKALFGTMEKYHLTISEYPPYVGPKKWHFPMRNRIISGLAQAVIVTEAREKSGTVSTLQHALDNGKDVYCVPGPITSPLSLGPNQSLLEGAKPVWNGFQIVEDLLSFAAFKK